MNEHGETQLDGVVRYTYPARERGRAPLKVFQLS